MVIDCTQTLAAVGVVAAAFLTVKAIQFFHLVFVANTDVAKYRVHGTWAVVTGGSDGIGKEIALNLARKKFNVFLVARNKEKLLAAAKEMMAACPGVEVRAVVLDFSTAQPADYERAFDEISREAVSVLVNNAGVCSEIMEFFVNGPVEADVAMLKVNCESQLYFTKWFLKHVGQRTGGARGGAMLNVSSMSAIVPAPLLSWYAGTKALNRVFSNNIALEVKQQQLNIDVLTITPGFVKTKMTGDFEIHSGFMNVETPSMVRQTLRKVGAVGETCGHLYHEIIAWFMSMMPGLISNTIGLQNSLKSRSQSLKQRAALKKSSS